MATLRAGPELLINCQVTTWVSSQNSDIDQIDGTTPSPLHIIQIDNTSAVPRDARVQGKLPNGTTVLRFDDGGTKTDTWTKDIMSMTVNEVRERNCALEHVSASSAPEPVRCEAVWTKRGKGAWVSETGKIPLGVQVDVN